MFCFITIFVAILVHGLTAAASLRTRGLARELARKLALAWESSGFGDRSVSSWIRRHSGGVVGEKCEK